MNVCKMSNPYLHDDALDDERVNAMFRSSLHIEFERASLRKDTASFRKWYAEGWVPYLIAYRNGTCCLDFSEFDEWLKLTDADLYNTLEELPQYSDED